MIDTVVLTFKQYMFTILDRDKFTPSASEVYDASFKKGGRAFRKCTQNPTRRELESGIYKPRLTLIKRVNREGKYEITLRVEFSVPKLIYGNNFNELRDSDFKEVVRKFDKVLREMGVFVYGNYLKEAPVSVVHYSKNIILKDYTTPYFYLEQLSKLNINERLDTNRTDFRNEGHSFKYRASSFEVVFYDKKKDLKQAKVSGKRSEEKDNALQLNLLDVLERQRPFEVLRMEIRLNKRAKVTQILRKIDQDLEPTLVNIFSEEIAKKVLLHFIEEIESAYPPLLIYEDNSPKDFFNSFLITNPEIKLPKALKMLGLRVLLDEAGVRGFRQMTRRYGNSTWYSLKKEMEAFKPETPSVFATLKKEIAEFEPVNLIVNRAEMINNDKYD